MDSLIPLLDVLDRYHTRATFFILGAVAEAHPDIVELIFDQGHAIASHSYSHLPLNLLGEDRFEKELQKSKNLLYKITNEAPRGFRAPTFSLNNKSRWALDVLERNGFSYDSSVFPVCSRLYGVPDAPLEPYKPSKDNIAVHDPTNRITEIPLSVLRIAAFNIPIAGGFYLRAFPLWFLKRAIRMCVKERPAVLYVHPWETFPAIPKLQAPLRYKFEAYHGVKTALKKVTALVREFSFLPIEEAFDID